MTRAEEIITILKEQYPQARCELSFNSDFELLVAVILSAQCTDKRVNTVTEKLFLNYRTPEDFAGMSEETLGELIRPCGFFRNKAKNIIETAKDITERFGGKVPEDYDALLSLKGVGRKTANVVSSELFGNQAIAVDTHVFRTAKRLGMSNGKTPEEVESDLTRDIRGEMRLNSHHLLVFFGRYCCHSRNPECKRCCVKQYCTKEN